MAIAAAAERNQAGIAPALGILKQRFGERLQTGAGDPRAARPHHHLDPDQPPDAVVWPERPRRCARSCACAPSIACRSSPFGVGSSLEGHVNAPGGGISLDMSRMNRVLAVNAEDLDCAVEPGVTRKQLNRLSARHRPVLPDRSRRQRQPRRHGGDARLGHQRRALRHDARQRAVADCGDGRRRDRQDRASAPRRRSAGYDLTRLLIGSEGTLGIITELTLQPAGHPAGDLRRRVPVPDASRQPAPRSSRRSRWAFRWPASSWSMRCRCAR